jgi:hypothetical protein
MALCSDLAAGLLDSFRLPLLRRHQEDLVRDLVGFSNKIRLGAGVPTKQFRRVNSEG